MIKYLITDARVDALWIRIDDVEKRAVGDNNLGAGDRRKALDNIRGARNLLLGGKQNYEDALRYVVEVESDMVQATRLKSWSIKHGALLLIYNLAWLVALGVGLTYSKQVATFFAGTGVDQVFFITILCGGLGGVSGALRSMWVHIAKDPRLRSAIPHVVYHQPDSRHGVSDLCLLGGAVRSGRRHRNRHHWHRRVCILCAGVVSGLPTKCSLSIGGTSDQDVQKDDVGKAQDAPTKPPSTTTEIKPKS